MDRPHAHESNVRLKAAWRWVQTEAIGGWMVKMSSTASVCGIECSTHYKMGHQMERVLARSVSKHVPGVTTAKVRRHRRS